MAGLGSETDAPRGSPQVAEDPRRPRASTLLEEALRQVLPAGTLAKCRRGSRTARSSTRRFASATDGLAIDSKFPLENFRRATNARNETERKNARSQFRATSGNTSRRSPRSTFGPPRGRSISRSCTCPRRRSTGDRRRVGEEEPDGTALSRKRVDPGLASSVSTPTSTRFRVRPEGTRHRETGARDRKGAGDLKRGVSKIEDPFGQARRAPRQREEAVRRDRRSRFRASSSSCATSRTRKSQLPSRPCLCASSRRSKKNYRGDAVPASATSFVLYSDAFAVLPAAVAAFQAPAIAW